MAKIRNVSGEELYVPSLSRLVQSGQVVEVDPERVYAFTQLAIWEAVDKEAKAAEKRKAREAKQAAKDAAKAKAAGSSGQPAANP